MILVLMNGRPLDLSEEANIVNSILEVWYPGAAPKSCGLVDPGSSFCFFVV